MAWSDGGDFQVGETYLRLWDIRDLVRANEQLHVQSYLPGTVAIGNDAGDMLYLLDYREHAAEPRLIEVEAGAIFDPDECVVRGATFTAALHAWSGIDRVRGALLACLAARLHQVERVDEPRMDDGNSPP